MSRSRQLRINDISNQVEKIKGFSGKTVNLVFRDDRVITGVLNTVTAELVTLTNMRNKVMSFSMSDVAELYFDRLE
jgi:hypothetical protein